MISEVGMQTNKLAGKVAIITGAARRIGAAIAKSLHAEGMNIALHYNHSSAHAQELCAQLNSLRKHSAITIAADLKSTGSEKILLEQTLSAWQRVDVLINNASSFYRTHIAETTKNTWDDLLDTNLKSPFFIAQTCFAALKKELGCIINIADIHALTPLKDYAVYCVSKSGLVMLTKSLAKEFAPDIRVNAIAPGAILWPEGENTLSAEAKQKIIDATLLKRAGHPNDIAKTVLFLVRDATYITGQVIAVDGGRSL